jgi:ArsR family transcriptional regulator
MENEKVLFNKEMYENKANIFKALSDNKRLQIINMLSCEEKCACDLLAKFEITQPTLSHHMKVLTDIGLVNSYKDSNWIKYSLNNQKFEEIKEFIIYISNNKPDCICKI